MPSIPPDLQLEIARLAGELEKSLPTEALAFGWRPDTWAKWAQIFRQLESDAKAGRLPPLPSMSRAMDFDGVIGGALLDRAASVSNALRQLS